MLENSNKVFHVLWQAGDIQKETPSNAEASAGNNQSTLSRANWPPSSTLLSVAKTSLNTAKIWTTFELALESDDLSTGG